MIDDTADISSSVPFRAGTQHVPATVYI